MVSRELQTAGRGVMTTQKTVMTGEQEGVKAAPGVMRAEPGVMKGEQIETTMMPLQADVQIRDWLAVSPVGPVFHSPKAALR